MTINEVVIAGRLTKDPEVKSLQSGGKVCSFTVAMDRYMGKDKDADTDFVPCVAWNSQAEFIEKYFSKGRKIIIKGNIRTRTWDDDDNKRHWVTEVWVEKVDFADSKNSNGNGSSNNGDQKTTRNEAPPLPGEHSATASSSGSDNLPPWMRK